ARKLPRLPRDGARDDHAGHGRGHPLHLLEELRLRGPEQHRLLGDEGGPGPPGATARGGARRAPDPRQRHQPRRGGARLRHLRRRLGRLAREGVRGRGGEAGRVLRAAHPAGARGAAGERGERGVRPDSRGSLAHHGPARPRGCGRRCGVPAMSTGEVGACAVAAIDLGATSGRVMLGVVARGRIDLVPAHRFENRLAQRDGHLSWDLDALWQEIQQGLAAAHDLAQLRGLPGLASLGVDSWAVDYALVSPDGDRIGEVIAYRDDRTDGVAERLAETVSAERQFALTGIAQQLFNTLYQLAVDDRLATLPAGSTALLVPDAIGFLLTGQRRTELTNASTTGMLAAGEAAWAPELLAAAGVDEGLFAPFIAPGEVLGTVRPELAVQLGIGEVPVVAVGSHDTASAVLAVPAEASAEGAPVAYISSGTWSLIGLELEAPVVAEEAR